MITIKPFKALRPSAQYATHVASLPYDVMNRAEAKLQVQGNPHSFLHITRSEINSPESTDVYDESIYKSAAENLRSFISRGVLFQENKDCYYIYRLIMNGRSQSGLVCVSSVEDYNNNLIKKHEFTRPVKENDRINHIYYTKAQTGNVFLAYKNVEAIDTIIANWQESRSPIYDFIASDGIQHSVWVVNTDEVVSKITDAFATNVAATYIADGHHRAASAAKSRQRFIDNNQNVNADFFLTTLFPSNQLHIMDYNRVVTDLNGHTPEQVLEKLQDQFTISIVGKDAFKPEAIHEFGMYLAGNWYKLVSKDNTYKTDPIGILDVTILQENILEPVFNILDQRTDSRIDFVGGIRGVQELANRVDSGEMAVAFSIYPVSIQQLFDISDAGSVMPPKSTWFEPKLRDGLLTHLVE